MNKGYQGVPVMLADEREHRRQIAQAVNNQLTGKLNAVTQVTLTPSATSTTLVDSRIGANTFIGFTPRSADAVTALISGLYVSSKQKGQATLTHASSANVDQTFDVLLIG